MLFVKLRIQDFFSEVWWIWIIYLFAFRCVEKDRRHEGKVYVWSLVLIPELYRLKLLNSESVLIGKRTSHENWQVLRCQKCLKSHQSQLRFWLVAWLTCYRIWQVFPKVAMLEYQKTLHISKKNRAVMPLFLYFCCVFPVFCRLLLKLKNTRLEIYLQTVSLFLNISRDFRNFDKCWSLDFAEFGQCLQTMKADVPICPLGVKVSHISFSA